VNTRDDRTQNFLNVVDPLSLPNFVRIGRGLSKLFPSDRFFRTLPSLPVQ